MSEYGLLIDYEYCTGCHACELACKQEYHRAAGKVGGIRVMEFVEQLIVVAQEVATNYRVHQMSTLYGWFQSRVMMRRYFGEQQQTQREGYSIADVETLLEGDTQLICLSISEPATMPRATTYAGQCSARLNSNSQPRPKMVR